MPSIFVLTTFCSIFSLFTVLALNVENIRKVYISYLIILANVQRVNDDNGITAWKMCEVPEAK